MKRAIAFALSIVIVCGLVPAPAFATGRLQARTLLAAGTVGVEAVELAFPGNEALYNAVVTQLGEQGVTYTADKTANSIGIDAREAATVTGLNLGYSNIDDLAGIGELAKLPKLTRLDLDHNALKENACAPLSTLTQLTYLDLYGNKPNDWSFLATLVNLEHLNIAGAYRGGATREALKNLKKLKWLDFSHSGRYESDGLSYNYIMDVIGELPNLEYLDLCGCQNISDLRGTEQGSGGIGNLKRLKTILLNYSELRDITPLLSCTQLEELHLAGNRVNWKDKEDNLACLFDEDGDLKIPLKKLDLRLQDSRHDYFRAGYPAHDSVNRLYQLHKQKKLEFGYDWHWIDELAGMQPHVDSTTGEPYIAYEDFGTFCREGSDDWWAMQNAHDYANEHGCEVRSVVGEGASAAEGKTYHVYRLHNSETINAYTSVDWQGATVYIHDEELDWHYTANKRLIDFCPSPAGFTASGKRLVDNTRTFDVEAADDASKLTVNEDMLPLKTTTTSIRGLSPQVDSAMSELGELGYQRFFVQLYDSNITRYNRGYTYKRQGGPQWDALIVDANGLVKRLNAAKKAGADTPEGSFIPEDPDPLQWQFDHVTKVVIAPIADAQAHIRNARFVTMPFNSRQQLPLDRWSWDYVRVLEITGTNFELSGITQTLGTEQTGWDHDAYSGLYTGFLDLKDCAELDMHDCYTWDRLCTRSTYGITTTRMIDARIKNVGDSNPVPRTGDWGNHGGNYAKHMLWENITLGRIDQHTGCYDMAVRDSDVGSLSLTGAGPLTVERTRVTSGSFFNLRGDYGSTWDGVAHVVGCTHRVVMDARQEPCGFAASTAQLDWDFGYPQKFPELHVKDFTIDCSRYTRNIDGTRYRVTYGFPSNHIGGLNSLNMKGQYPAVNYWPDTLEIDGLNIVNYEDTLGSELHVASPLYMLGKPAEQARSGDWTLKNVSYDGKPFEPAGFEGDEELALTGKLPAELTAQPERKFMYVRFGTEKGAQIEEALPTHDVAIAYKGDEPRFLLRSERIGGEGYADTFPYLIEHRGDVNVAYFSGRELLNDQLRKEKEGAPEGGTFYAMLIDCPTYTGNNGDPSVLGNAEVLHVRLVKTHDFCEHEWGEPTYEWSADNASVTARAVCKLDGGHVRESTVSTTYEVKPQPTATTEGVGTYTAMFAKAPFTTQVKTVDISATGEVAPPLQQEHVHSWGEPTYEWADDLASVTARAVCNRDSTHVIEERATVESAVVKQPTGTEAGELVCTARFSKVPFADQVRHVAIPPTGASGSDASEDDGSRASDAAVRTKPVYRLAHAKTGQRRYVTGKKAAKKLAHGRWHLEGVAFFAPARGGKPVYQLKRAGRYTYTAKPAEVRKLKKAGWKSKKTVFRALASGGVKVYRLRNRATGAYLLTKSVREVSSFKRMGWKSQGVAFRVVR